MIEIGDVVPDLALKITDASGALADGGVVTCVITLPDGTTSSQTGSILHPSLGIYRLNYTAAVVGLHLITWTVTGVNAGAYNDTFVVELQAFGIVSLSETKAHLRITRSNDDEILRTLILAASSACESAEGTNRVWRRRAVTAELHDVGSFVQLNFHPVLSITAIRIDGAVQDLTQLDFFPQTGELYPASGFGSGRRNSMSVDYVVGPTGSIPPLVRDGVLEMVRHLYAVHRGGSNLPRQEEPDYTTSLAYLIPNRVAMAWRAFGSGF